MKRLLLILVVLFSFGIFSCGSEVTAPSEGAEFTSQYDAPQERPKIGSPFNRILKELKLDSNQKIDVNLFLKELKDCVKSINLLKKPILDEYKLEKKSIMDQLKASTINREEAKRLINELNEKTRLKLEYLNLKSSIQNCEKEFYEKVKSILNDEQKVKFNRWLSIKKGK